MTYDYDVVVVGAGPAGLAAATRVRWVKGYHALAGSVCIVESGAPGGLLRWGSCVLTGPGWACSGQELSDRLMTDVRRLSIPIVHDRVTAVRREGPTLRVECVGGRGICCLAVVLATGFRRQGNESEWYLRGVRITFKGYEHFPALARQCAEDASGRGLVVVGNEKTRYLAAILEPVAEAAGGLTVVDRGELIEVIGGERVEAVRIREAGGERRVECGAVLMDYNGFELTPSFDIGGLELERDERGFVVADSLMRTSEEGVFVAGDLTGRYAATLMALGDGVAAGLSAYAHAFERKLGVAPRLFAYAPTDGPVPARPIDIPEIPDDAVPVAVGAGAPSWVDGQRTLEEHAAARGTSVAELRGALTQGIAEKTVTVHRIEGG